MKSKRTAPAASPLPVVPPDRIDRTEPFDVGMFTIQARMKLQTLSFLLSQAKIELSVGDEVFHGLAWMLDDIRESLEEKGGA